jgi:phosphohistidine phosphatase
MGERTLVVVRHAKAEQDGPTDLERPLADRGHVDAADAGRWLAEAGVVPDHALVSAAVRTDETWQALADAAGWSLEPELDRGLYSAGIDSALDLVRVLGDDVRCVVLLGHNPTMGSLAQLLDDGDGDPDASSLLLGRGFPTSAVAVFDYDGSWADLAPATASLRAFHVGRD